jgi:hypothetical protein
MSEDNSAPNEPIEPNEADEAAKLRGSATKLIWQGTAWWTASIVAFSIALASTSNTVFYYYGGFIYGAIV